MFFTSVLVPSGSPGLWTDTLASTLSWPSVEGDGGEAHSVGKEFGFSGMTAQKKIRGRKAERQRVISIPDMLPWQVPRDCRMSWSSLTAAAASSPQLISGSITSSIRPTPDACEDSCVVHLWGIHPMVLCDKPQQLSLCWALLNPRNSVCPTFFLPD